MKIIDEALLDEFRQSGYCEWCGRWFVRLDAAHVFARGMGGGGRLDVRVNLLGLCRRDHDLHHAGHKPTRDDLIALIAKREGLTPEAVVAEITRLRNLPKGSPVPAAPATRRDGLRGAAEVRKAAELLHAAVAGAGEKPLAMVGAHAALLWVLGDAEGAFAECLAQLEALKKGA